MNPVEPLREKLRFRVSATGLLGRAAEILEAVKDDDDFAKGVAFGLRQFHDHLSQVQGEPLALHDEHPAWLSFLDLYPTDDVSLIDEVQP